MNVGLCHDQKLINDLTETFNNSHYSLSQWPPVRSSWQQCVKGTGHQATVSPPQYLTRSRGWLQPGTPPVKQKQAASLSLKRGNVCVCVCMGGWVKEQIQQTVQKGGAGWIGTNSEGYKNMLKCKEISQEGVDKSVSFPAAAYLPQRQLCTTTTLYTSLA